MPTKEERSTELVTTVMEEHLGLAVQVSMASVVSIFESFNAGRPTSYFPLTVSSIYLPLWGEDTGRRINKILDKPKIWDTLVAGLDDGKFIQAVRCETVAAIYQVDPQELQEAAQRKFDGTVRLEDNISRSEEKFRRQEYEALRTGRGGETTDLMVEVCDPGEYGADLGRLLNSVCLVKKLRETRVLVGFSRLLPVEDATSPELLSISVDPDLGWLPATVVHGEGIFIEFNPRDLRVWAENPDVRARVLSLKAKCNQRRRQRGLKDIEVTAKYLLLHTFAHCLISQLSFDCGYGSASLRERIYCNLDESDEPMQGVLVYTASGDSEGTLGGLVRQGLPDRMTTVIERAINRIRWCSSDPVCIESVGQGTDNANLAACHGCVLLPETSCEMGNRLLDRGLMVGLPGNTEIGYFSRFCA